MLLKKWLLATGMKPYQFAKKIGISKSSIYKTLNGKQRLSINNAKKIEIFTNGSVSRTEALWPEDFEEDGSGIAGRWIPPSKINYYH